MLDERLKKSAIEQTIYKFVPLTNAAEVELHYVRNFMQAGNAAEYLKKLKPDDRALYVGAERWPEDAFVSDFLDAKNSELFAGRMSFLIENRAEGQVRPPKGLFAHEDLWRKFAEISATHYAGIFPLHFLDATAQKLSGLWGSYHCVHASGRELKPGKKSPLIFAREGAESNFRLNFRWPEQLQFSGRLSCINTPKADTIFEIFTTMPDVAIEAFPGRFSAWNEAQPLRIRVQTARSITAPLALEIVPEMNATTVEFFFQGDRITCEARRCRKKDARFLMPAFTDFSRDFELAVRASGDSYFRGTLRLMAGEIEIARTPFRFTPHSWLGEAVVALQNPSEYKSFFLKVLILVTTLVALLTLLVLASKRLWRYIADHKPPQLPKQASASVLIQPGKFKMTASKNPFGCELMDFGGIVAMEIAGDRVHLSHGGRMLEASVENFLYRLPDGYVIALRSLNGSYLLEAYLVGMPGGHFTSERDSSTTSQTPVQNPDLSDAHG